MMSNVPVDVYKSWVRQHEDERGVWSEAAPGPDGQPLVNILYFQDPSHVHEAVWPAILRMVDRQLVQLGKLLACMAGLAWGGSARIKNLGGQFVLRIWDENRSNNQHEL